MLTHVLSLFTIEVAVEELKQRNATDNVDV